MADLLHKSNAWSDVDCRREDCLISKSTGPEGKKESCKKWNVLYETYYISCWKKEEKEKEKREMEVVMKTSNDCESKEESRKKETKEIEKKKD